MDPVTNHLPMRAGRTAAPAVADAAAASAVARAARATTGGAPVLPNAEFSDEASGIANLDRRFFRPMGGTGKLDVFCYGLLAGALLVRLAEFITDFLMH